MQLVTGDTKVVDSGSGDGVYVNTAGIGVVPDGVDIGPRRATVGDAVIVSGDIGVHGVAVMSCREGLEFGTTIESDTAPLHGLVADMLATGADVHVLRDPTRGGVSATLNEIARASGGRHRARRARPAGPAEVRDACGLLGLDPLQVANEGKLLAIVPAESADEVLAAMQAHPLGAGARRIGTCVADHPRHGGGPHRARRHPGRRPADRRAAAPDLLSVSALGSAAVRAVRLPAERARLLRAARRARHARPRGRRRDRPAGTAVRGRLGLPGAPRRRDRQRRPARRRRWSRRTGSAAICSTRSRRTRWSRISRTGSAASWAAPGGRPRTRALPHHSFQVFEVYPWAQLLLDGKPPGPAVQVLDRCRIRVGEVVEIADEEVDVVCRPLEWDGHAPRRGRRGRRARPLVGGRSVADRRTGGGFDQSRCTGTGCAT